MCSTPKSSGTTCQVRRLVEENADYASYSQMLRRASHRFDQRQREREAQRKRQAEALASSGKLPEAEAPRLSYEDASAMHQPLSRRSIVSRLLSYLGRLASPCSDSR
jgi:hypothetical protein